MNRPIQEPHRYTVVEQPEHKDGMDPAVMKTGSEKNGQQ